MTAALVPHVVGLGATNRHEHLKHVPSRSQEADRLRQAGLFGPFRDDLHAFPHQRRLQAIQRLGAPGLEAHMIQTGHAGTGRAEFHRMVLLVTAEKDRAVTALDLAQADDLFRVGNRFLQVRHLQSDMSEPANHC